MKTSRPISKNVARKKYLIVLLGALVLVSILFIFKITKPPAPPRDVPENLQESGSYTQEAVHDFSERSRIVTSPELTGNDRNGWGLFKFQVYVPEGWKVSETLYSDNKTGYMISLAREDKYFVDINYGDGYGPQRCVFPSEKKLEEYIDYLDIENFTEVRNGLGIVRIPTKYRNDNSESNSDQLVIYKVCQSNSGGWTTSTKLDQISIRLLSNDNASASSEARDIIKSLKILSL